MGACPPQRGEFPREGVPRFLQLDDGPGLGGPSKGGELVPGIHRDPSACDVTLHRAAATCHSASATVSGFVSPDGRRAPGAEGASGQLLYARCPAQDHCGQDASESAMLVGRGRGSRHNHWLIQGCVSCQLSAAPAPESRAGDTEGAVGLLREQFLLRGLFSSSPCA